MYNKMVTTITSRPRPALIAIFALSLIERSIWLGNIPGINGDEAWWGILASKPLDLSQRTPTGNLVSVFYLIPLSLIQKLFPPNFVVLRSVSLLSGLAVVILGYFLFHKVLGDRPAFLFVILCAVLPDLVAYSRFGWESSETGLAALLLLYFSLQKKWGGALVMQLIAVLIHPSNILLIFVPASLFLFETMSSLRAPIGKKAIGILILCAAFILIGSFFLLTQLGPLTKLLKNLPEVGQAVAVIKRLDPHSMLDRISSLSGWKDFFGLYGDLISGVTIYRYIVGPVSGWNAALHAVVFWVIIAPIILYGCWMGLRKKEFQAAAVLCGTLLGLITMHVLFGDGPISPNYERYSQFLIIPTVLLFAIGLNSLDARVSTPAAVLVCAFWVTSMAANYFVPFLQTGGLTHETFRTASIEPKQQAVDILLDNWQKTDGGIIVAENWWVANPVGYLLVKRKDLVVVQYDRAGSGFDINAALRDRDFVISFSGSPFDQAISDGTLSGHLKKWVVLDYGGKPVLDIWHLSD